MLFSVAGATSGCAQYFCRFRIAGVRHGVFPTRIRRACEGERNVLLRVGTPTAHPQASHSGGILEPLRVEFHPGGCVRRCPRACMAHHSRAASQLQVTCFRCINLGISSAVECVIHFDSSLIVRSDCLP